MIITEETKRKLISHLLKKGLSKKKDFAEALKISTKTIAKFFVENADLETIRQQNSKITTAEKQQLFQKKYQRKPRVETRTYAARAAYQKEWKEKKRIEPPVPDHPQFQIVDGLKQIIIEF